MSRPIRVPRGAYAVTGDIIAAINELLGLPAGTKRKISGDNFTCDRTSGDIIMVRYTGRDIGVTTEVANAVQESDRPRPGVVTDGVVTFSI